MKRNDKRVIRYQTVKQYIYANKEAVKAYYKELYNVEHKMQCIPCLAKIFAKNKEFERLKKWIDEVYSKRQS